MYFSCLGHINWNINLKIFKKWRKKCFAVRTEWVKLQNKPTFNRPGKQSCISLTSFPSLSAFSPPLTRSYVKFERVWARAAPLDPAGAVSQNISLSLSLSLSLSPPPSPSLSLSLSPLTSQLRDDGGQGCDKCPPTSTSTSTASAALTLPHTPPPPLLTFSLLLRDTPSWTVFARRHRIFSFNCISLSFVPSVKYFRRCPILYYLYRTSNLTDKKIEIKFLKPLSRHYVSILYTSTGEKRRFHCKSNCDLNRRNSIVVCSMRLRIPRLYGIESVRSWGTIRHGRYIRI